MSTKFVFTMFTMNFQSQDALHFDQHHLWHPYTSATNPLPCYLVKQAKGVMIELENGQVLIDGMSSWWACIHGYQVPELDQALLQQRDNMSHVMFGGLTHKPAIALGKRLLSIVPQGLTRIFFADSGSVSVEVALKMALQYQRGRGKVQRQKYVSLLGGYHGDTFGAMSVCDPHTGMHRMFQGALRQQIFVPKPACRFDETWDDSAFTPMQDCLLQHQDEIAAVIVEPIVQGAGGMYFYHPRYLDYLQKLCRELDILLIADEIATGFGRTGKLFACQWSSITPDILCLGKALTGGYMTLAATLCTDAVAQGIDRCESGVLMHGPTFMANPLACAVALASVNKLLQTNWQRLIDDLHQHLCAFLTPLKDYPYVQDVRCLGAIGVVEMDSSADVAKVQRCFVKHGVWIRPFGRLIYVMPPYCINKKQIQQLAQAIKDVVSNWPDYTNNSK